MGLSFSIIVPCLNHARLMERTIQSVLSQDYEPLELIVVDGGSSDGTVEILQRYSEDIKWVSEKDRSQSDAYNKGYRMSSGEVIGSLGAGDMYPPGAIEKAASYFQEHSDVDVIYGGCLKVDEEGRITGKHATEEFNYDRLLNQADYINQEAAFIRRKVLEKVGFMDVELHYAMDLDLWLRIGKSGEFKIRRVPDTLAIFLSHHDRKTSGQSRGVRERYWQEILMVTKRHGRKFFSARRRRYYWYRLRALVPPKSTFLGRLARQAGRRVVGWGR
jgi:glycosyltransferase involved in cell wall biosynthesis